MYPAISISVSSVSSTSPAFAILFSLSSSLVFIPDEALAEEKTFSGLSAESPYLSFLLSKRSCKFLHLVFILSFVFIYS